MGSKTRSTNSRGAAKREISSLLGLLILFFAISIQYNGLEENMETINILGTGSAMVTKCYNTCFTISDGREHFLVDTGGGNTVLVNLEKLKIDINQVRHVFISHSHNDHMTGIVWIIRAVAQAIIDGRYEGDLTIYCHKDNIDGIKIISGILLEKKFSGYLGRQDTVPRGKGQGQSFRYGLEPGIL